MPRSLILGVCLLGLLSGCTSTRYSVASRSNPDELARVTEAFAGETVHVQMVLETDEGRFVEVLADSTRWVRPDGSLQSVSTSEVRQIQVRDNGATLLLGTAIGLGLATLGVSSAVRSSRDADSWPEALLPVLGAIIFSPVLIGIGVAGGANATSPTTVWIRP